jgi:hypothetical protein
MMRASLAVLTTFVCATAESVTIQGKLNTKHHPFLTLSKDVQTVHYPDEGVFSIKLQPIATDKNKHAEEEAACHKANILSLKQANHKIEPASHAILKDLADGHLGHPKL